MRRFGYFIMAKGKKRIGGTVTADTMEDAVRQIMVRDGVTVKITDKYRKPNGHIGVEANFEIDGDEANIAVWANPEEFGPTSEAQVNARMKKLSSAIESLQLSRRPKT